MISFRHLLINQLMSSEDWTGKPADWSDIRKDCPKNSIALYAGHTADYSQYDNLGFTATCVGGYKVYIDGNVYGSYASGSTCSITWSTSSITTGDDITTPSALKAHKIWIEPATEGNNITAFNCQRVASSGFETQGILWAHFNLTNPIQIAAAFGNDSTYRNTLIKAITAKNNLINYTVAAQVSKSGFYCLAPYAEALEYLPILKAQNQSYPSGSYFCFVRVPAKKIVVKNNKGTETFGMLNQTKIEELDIENGLTLSSGTSNSNSARGATKLKKWPKTNLNKAENFVMYDCPDLEPVNIDDRFNDTRKLFRFYGTQSTPTPALKSLRVSNQAPFDYATAPQIDVSYTGLDRTALVQLFNDLPYNVGYEVVGSPTINNGVISGFTLNDYAEITNTLNFSTPFEIGIKIQTPSSTIDNEKLLYFKTLADRYGFILYVKNNKFAFAGSFNGTTWGFDTNGEGSYTVQPNTVYYIRVSWDLSEYKLDYSLDGINYTNEQTIINSSSIITTDLCYIGRYFNSGAFTGYIDLNETYIKINDVYWFRGQPAMTKTLSCVGATGTADLTAEDKDIALNKGWSLTLS